MFSRQPPYWRMAFASLLFVPWLSAAATTAPATRVITDLDRVLAIVNDDVITESELIDRLARTKRQLALEKIKLPADDVLRRQLLEHMVNERIQLQLADQAGIKVTDAEVDEAIDNVAKKNKLSVADFNRKMAREGIDPKAYAQEMRYQLIIRRLLEREVNNRVTVSDSEVADFLAAHPRGGETEYNLSHIFLPLPESATPEAIQSTRKRADNIRQQLKDGANFEQLAVTHSHGETAMNGGALGWKKAGQLPELFVSTLKALEPGTVSDVVRGPNGFHILRLNSRRGDAPMAKVSQTHARHILLRRSEVQSLDDARIKLLNLRQRIEHGEDFALLARANSEDPGSAANGGDLGWTNPGQFVPAFESAMDTLKPGQLSQPVQTPFGLHLIQVIERRTQDISKERLETTARNQIHSRKASERYEQWLRQVRDEAFVEYFLEDVN